MPVKSSIGFFSASKPNRNEMVDRQYSYETSKMKSSSSKFVANHSALSKDKAKNKKKKAKESDANM